MKRSDNTVCSNIRLYGDKAYIFCGETLVTVIQIPAGLMKDFREMVKEVREQNETGKTAEKNH